MLNQSKLIFRAHEGFDSKARIMSSNDDFTFCKVPKFDEKCMIDTQKVTPNISEMNVNDGSSSSSGNDGNNDNAVMEKQEKVGSLTFNVSDTSKKGGNEAEKSKPAMKKPVRRAKIPLEKGYSQMDWLKLTRTHPDLAGLRGKQIGDSYP
ncbi:reductase [Lithospermum erythrorhizon]|uniref:Reductase n=1 Tax=Lithospermum erythrorhizon TaxID=34254 RepID=A0AAV3PP98_LITER